MANMTYDVKKAFERIENELISSMIRNMKRHQAWEDKDGFQWGQWQAYQLQSLERYRINNAKKYNDQFAKINSKIKAAIKAAYDQGNADQEIAILKAIKKGLNAESTLTGQFFRVNERKVETLINATMSDIQKAEHSVLRRANDQYRQIIFDAQMYAATGSGTYEQSVDMATKDFLAKGIDSIEYSNGARHTISDYADMVLRTAVKRAYLQGEGTKRQEWGISTVIVNKRGNACPKCVPFCGKVLIDDVWSGGKPEDGNYPLMSQAIAAGLYHPRCKDSHTTYFEGITTADGKWTKKELQDIADKYEDEQKRKYWENMAKKYDRLAKCSLDNDNRKKYSDKRNKYVMNLQRFGSGKGNVTLKELTDVTSEYLNKSEVTTGRIVIPENYDAQLHKREIEVAKILSDMFGGVIETLAEENLDHVETPDYIWNGKLWELKSPSQSLNAIDKRLQKGLHQISKNPGGVIIDLESESIPLVDIVKKAENRIIRTADNIECDVIIMIKDKIKFVIRN